MHGNNKTERRAASYAFDAGVGHVDRSTRFDEIERARASARAGRRQEVLIRVTPGIKPSTHSYVQTGQLDSKFGFGLEDGLARAGGRARSAPREHLELVGLHAHIGSQIFELEPYVRGDRGARRASSTPDWCRLLNVGGGLGIAYTRERRAALDRRLRRRQGRAASQRVFDPVPRILVEPGRSLVGNAGVTVYTVGTVKEIPGVRTYVAVDGGMSDNLRPMLYGSRYEAADRRPRRDAGRTRTATIAGMHCESGDMLDHATSTLADPRPATCS